MDVDEQRAHFRSDWHHYNVEMRVAASKVVTKAEFSQLVVGERTISIIWNRVPIAINDGAAVLNSQVGLPRRTFLALRRSTSLPSSWTAS